MFVLISLSVVFLAPSQCLFVVIVTLYKQVPTPQKTVLVFLQHKVSFFLALLVQRHTEASYKEPCQLRLVPLFAVRDYKAD